MRNHLYSKISVLVLLGLSLPALAQAQTSPFEMMETVFEGTHSKAEIKRIVYKIDELYSFERPAPKKYEAIGSVAVELAKDEPFTEMQLLRCTISAQNELVTEFADVAGLCATQLSNQ